MRPGSIDARLDRTLVALADRPRRLAFTLTVPKYSQAEDRIQIEIRLRSGCELTLTHEMQPDMTEVRGRAEAGWRGILEVLAEQLSPEEQSCGAGLAQHASVPAKIARVFAGLAETLDSHRALLILSDEDARREDEAYRSLAMGYRELAARVERVAAEMASYRELPACAHDEKAFGERQLGASGASSRRRARCSRACGRRPNGTSRCWRR